MDIKVYSIKLDSPRWLRRAVVYFAIPAAAILGVSAVVYANVVVPNEFSNGEVLDAEKMNDNFAALEVGVNEATPPGSVMAYFGSTAPSGWLVADGSLVDAQANPDHAVLVNHLRSLGTAYQGALPSQAKLPDLRGLFLRGQDRGRNVNPDKAGDEIGRYQEGATKLPGTPFSTNANSHAHTITYGNDGQFGGYHEIGTLGGSSTSKATSSSEHSHEVTGGGDSETRPKNATVLHIIKY